MTIQKAINSGKPFRRKDVQDDWIIVFQGHFWRCRKTGEIEMPEIKVMTTYSILATDWEIKDEETIKRGR